MLYFFDLIIFLIQRQVLNLIETYEKGILEYWNNGIQISFKNNDDNFFLLNIPAFHCSINF